ncbi:MAG: PstS family phosphate ABC transporter substrate-binding protein [Acidimicrobiales bacterium]|nr:PstS family phosphate ABC transporter substrate-binding protein [Acidimicrobiales bacterium]
MGRRAMAAFLVTVLAAAGGACGNDNADAFDDITDARAATDVEGRVLITGSSTVEPVSTLVGEAFRAQNDRVAISVEGPGTGDGMARFCDGGAEITGASRPISAPEIEACAASGIDFVELAIGLDGVAVVVAPGNPVECLTKADLYALVGPESLGVDRWRDAEPLARELGSTTELPDENLVLTGPGEESGTYDSFVEQVLDPIAEQRVEAGALDADAVGAARADYAASANDNTIVDAVGADPGGLGWVGFSYAAGAEGVRTVAVAETPDDACVEPTVDSIRDGSYPIARTLYLYVAAEAAARPEVAAVVDFYLAGLDDFLRETEYVALADPTTTVDRWDDRTTGPA